jgi:hypothetical protein
MTDLHVANDLRFAEVEGRVVFLNFRSESYYVLDPVASIMWRQVALLRPRREILQTLEAHWPCEQYAVDAVRLAMDFDAFVNNCMQAGFLESRARSPSLVSAGPYAQARGRGRGFLTLRAWWSLWRASRWLAKRGFSGAYQRFSRLPRPVAPLAPAPLEPSDEVEAFAGGPAAEARTSTADVETLLLTRAIAAFSRAENFFHLRRAPQDCLPRSLALFGFLRQLGLGAEHVIGVQLFPFLAHAWVEYRGHVVHDDPENPRRFTAIAKIAA